MFQTLSKLLARLAAVCSIYLAVSGFADPHQPPKSRNTELHNTRCDWMPNGSLSENAYQNESLGFAYNVPLNWNIKRKLIDAMNNVPYRPSPPTDAVGVNGSSPKGRSCTLIVMARSDSQADSSSYPEVVIDLDQVPGPDEKAEVTARDTLRTMSSVDRHNPRLRSISEVREIRVAGLNFLYVDSEFLSDGKSTHYFHRVLLLPEQNHLSLEIRITGKSLEDLTESTRALNSLHFDRSRSKANS